MSLTLTVPPSTPTNTRHRACRHSASIMLTDGLLVNKSNRICYSRNTKNILCCSFVSFLDSFKLKQFLNVIHSFTTTDSYCLRSLQAVSKLGIYFRQTLILVQGLMQKALKDKEILPHCKLWEKSIFLHLQRNEVFYLQLQ